MSVRIGIVCLLSFLLLVSPSAFAKDLAVNEEIQENTRTYVVVGDTVVAYNQDGSYAGEGPVIEELDTTSGLVYASVCQCSDHITGSCPNGCGGHPRCTNNTSYRCYWYETLAQESLDGPPLEDTIQ
jgi:hypothetical protein